MTHSPIEKYCVRIKCKGHTGSGVLLPGRDSFYALTAAHCFGTTEPSVEEILIEKQNDYAAEFEEIKSVKIVEFNLEKDFALIEVDLNEEEKLLCKYKLGIGVLSENDIRFCGYQGVYVNQYRPFNGRILSVSQSVGRFKITLQNDTFDQAGEDGSYIAKGLSGSGVFIYRHSSPFLIGILNSVISDNAWNDDINCCSISHLESYIAEYVDLSDLENLKKWNENLEKNRAEKEIESFKNDESDFFDNLYRKNKILYPDIENANQVTADQIGKFLGMRDNIKTLENDYPALYLEFKNIVKRFVDQVRYDYSRTVNESNEAKDIKNDLRNNLVNKFSILPNFIDMDLSEFQIIEWLGICTLNFNKND
jgi:hypothetical protein